MRVSKLRSCLVSGVLLASLWTFAHDAHADDDWKSAAVACTPSVGAIGVLTDSGGHVTYASGQTGAAALYCPVRGNVASLYTIKMVYQDSDGQGSTGRVTTELVQIDKATGAQATVVDNTGAAIRADSNSSNATGVNYVFGGSFGPYYANLDFNSNYYVIVATFWRSSTSTTVSLYGVSIND